MSIDSLSTRVANEIRDACAAAFFSYETHGELVPGNVQNFPREIDPLVRPSDHADFQANVALPLAKKVGIPPRDLAQKIVEHLSSTLISSAEVSGPGFINITLADQTLIFHVYQRFIDDRLGLPIAEKPRRIVLDYAAPNVAKEMHVGHLRSAVIGNCLEKILTFAGHQVIPRHHIGDWGTSFGMLTEYLIDTKTDFTADDTTAPITKLNELYKNARARFEQHELFTENSRNRVVLLQSGDPETLHHWRSIVNISMKYFFDIFHRLKVQIHPDNIKGESYYNDDLKNTVKELWDSGVAQESDGALCVFFDNITGKDGKPVPLIVQKSDGGFGYATTDLAAIRDRVNNLHADEILYVVDARQSLHFKMVFDAAYRAGFAPQSCILKQISHGTILGKDGKPFKTRSGESALLIDLVEAATAKAEAEIRSKADGQLSEEQIQQRAHDIGIGALKYSDLSTSLGKDYIFDVDVMLNLHGNTSVYIQYAYARIQSIIRQNPTVEPYPHPEIALEPAERQLALMIDECANTLSSVLRTYEPHVLAQYLYRLSVAFTTFYDACSIKHAHSARVQENRLLLSQTTGKVLGWGLDLLGISSPDQL